MNSKYLTENSEWVKFYPNFNKGFYISKAGYFDERSEVITSLTQLIVLFALPMVLLYSLWGLILLPFLVFGWGKMYINLPIKTGIQDCDSAAWGINIIVDWNIERINWESEGWLTDFGVFSVKKSETATKDNVFRHATTHWKEII